MTTAIEPLAATAAERFHGERRQVLDPARADVLAEIPDATAADVDAAVAAARAAFERGEWRGTEAYERGTVLERAAARIRDHAEELARLDCANVGKPITQARGDVEGAALYLESAGRVVATLASEIVEDTDRQLTLVLRDPVGVVATIIPWNYPAALAAASISGPLAAGNSVVMKPSPETPLSALRIVELISDFFPAGTLQLVTGGADVGRALVRHDGVDRIGFTGSTRAGVEIMAGAAPSFKRVGLELGGKSPTVVFADAPLEPAIASALARITANQGENCAAGSRLLVERSIRDEFLERLAEAARAAVVGDPADEDTAFGPMITSAHRDRVLEYVAGARRESSLIAEGEVPGDGRLASGFFVPVSIWESRPDHRIWREEVFGPVLAVADFSGEREAVELANDTRYGLMAHVWSGDGARAVRVARQIRAGIVRVNRGFEPAFGPWGGYKASGFGRNFGRWGIEANSELKQVCLDLTPAA